MYAKHLLASLAGAVMFLAYGAAAQEWPQEPVHIVVPYPAGGGADALARQLGAELSKKWGQPVLVDNRPGASEQIAATDVARSKPDGYTLFWATQQALETNMFVFSNLNYDPETSFAPLTRIARSPLVYVVRSDSPIQSLEDIIARAKAEPDSLSYGSAGVGSIIHLLVNWLSIVADITFRHVPYDGVAPRMVDLMGGIIDFSASPPGPVMGQIASGDIRALATTGEERLAALPDVPTMKELGYPETSGYFYFSLVAPAGIDVNVASRIAADVASLTTSREFSEKYIVSQGFEPVGETPQAFSDFLKSDRPLEKARVEAAGVKLD